MGWVERMGVYWVVVKVCGVGLYSLLLLWVGSPGTLQLQMPPWHFPFEWDRPRSFA